MAAKTTKARGRFVDVSKAHRASLEAAMPAGLNGTEWRVLAAIHWFTTGWSKLEDAAYLAQIAEKAGLVKPDGQPDEKRVSKALRGIRSKAPGAISYEPGGGKRGIEGQDVGYPSRFILPKVRGTDRAQYGGPNGSSKGDGSDPPPEGIEPEGINPTRVDGYVDANPATTAFLDAVKDRLNVRHKPRLVAEWNDGISATLRRRIGRNVATADRSARALASDVAALTDLNNADCIPALIDDKLTKITAGGR